MKIDQLHHFMAAAKHQSVTKASRSLSISPSAISHSVSSLEKQLGESLFARERRRIRLTDKGRIFQERLSGILRDLERLQDDMSSPEIGLHGHYRLAATHSLATRYLTSAWSKLQRRNPAVTAEIGIMKSNDILKRAIQAELDLGLCFGPVSHPQIHSKVLATEEFVIAVRRDHPILKSRPLEMAKRLNELPCAAPRLYSGRSDYELPALERFRIKQSVDFVFETYEIALQRLVHSDSWALLPEWYARSPKLGIVRLKGWTAPVEIVAVSPSNKTLGRAIVELSEQVRSEILPEAIR
jgi:DNA-binding transcriptional LysR family regulator